MRQSRLGLFLIEPDVLSFKQFPARRKDNRESRRFRLNGRVISLTFKQLARPLHARCGLL